MKVEKQMFLEARGGALLSGDACGGSSAYNPHRWCKIDAWNPSRYQTGKRS